MLDHQSLSTLEMQTSPLKRCQGTLLFLLLSAADYHSVVHCIVLLGPCHPWAPSLAATELSMELLPTPDYLLWNERNCCRYDFDWELLLITFNCCFQAFSDWACAATQFMNPHLHNILQPWQFFFILCCKIWCIRNLVCNLKFSIRILLGPRGGLKKLPKSRQPQYMYNSLHI